MSTLSDKRCYSLGDCIEWLRQSDSELVSLTSNRNHNTKTTIIDDGDCTKEKVLNKQPGIILTNDDKSQQDMKKQQQQQLNNDDNCDNNRIDNLSAIQQSDEEELRTLRKRLKEWKEENEINFPKRRKILISSYANLIGAYEYGLQKISKLTDLNNAPDNVMDGNNYCIQKENFK